MNCFPCFINKKCCPNLKKNYEYYDKATDQFTKDLDFAELIKRWKELKVISDFTISQETFHSNWNKASSLKVALGQKILQTKIEKFRENLIDLSCSEDSDCSGNDVPSTNMNNKPL